MVEFYIVWVEFEVLVVWLVVNYVIFEEICVLVGMVEEDCKMLGDL